MDTKTNLTLSTVRGAILGAALGDALGAPVESLSAEEIKKRYRRLTEMTGSNELNLSPGQYTDDTELMLAVARGLLAAPRSPLNEIGHGFLRWYLANPYGIGLTTRLSIENYIRIGDWYEAARATAHVLNKLDSNGGLMRTLPVTYAYWDQPANIASWSAQIAFMTHHSQEGAACCIYYNLLVYLISREPKPAKRSAVTEAMILTDRYLKELRITPTRFFWAILRHVQSGADPIPPRGYVLDTLAASLQAFLNTDSYEEAVIEIVNRGEDTDTGGTVTGGLAGAYYGEQQLPPRWLARLHNREEIISTADKLYQLAVNP